MIRFLSLVALSSTLLASPAGALVSCNTVADAFDYIEPFGNPPGN